MDYQEYIAQAIEQVKHQKEFQKTLDELDKGLETKTPTDVQPTDKWVDKWMEGNS